MPMNTTRSTKCKMCSNLVLLYSFVFLVNCPGNEQTRWQTQTFTNLTLRRKK